MSLIKSFRIRSVLQTGTSVAAVAAVLAFSAPVLAAESDATLRGRIIGAPQGTVVTAADNSTGARTNARTGADGRYVIAGLRPGNYTVTVTAPDGQTRTEQAVLPVGQTVEVNSDFAAAASGEEVQEVTVVGTRRANPRQSEVATSVSRQQIETLPQQGRNFLNFAALAPGVSVSTDPERKTFQAGAVNANQVNVFIDGASQKQQVLQGGVAGQDASRGNPFPQLAIQEFKVSTQNFKAEYEQAGSAIISAVTKTGGRDFHGTVFGVLQTKDMIGKNHYQTGPKQDYENKEYGFDIGGPIIRDKLHFYLAYEGREDTRPTDSVNMRNNTVLNALNPALVDDLSAAYNGDFAKDFKQDMVFGKLTWFINEANTLDLSATHRQEDDIKDFSGTRAYERGSSQEQEIQAVNLKWRRRAGNWLNDMQLSWQNTEWQQAPLSTRPAITLTDGTNINSQLAHIGGVPYSQIKAQESITLRNDTTVTGIEWHGEHVIKFGFKVAKYDYTAEENDRLLVPEYFFDAATYQFGGSNNVPYAVRIADGNPHISSDNTQVGLYIQDDWTLNEHWSFNLGLRWDYESNMLNDDFVTPADVAAAIRAHPGFNAAFNANDYISTGSERDSFLGAIQPRLGFAYDVNGDRDLVIFGGYGRYYDRNIYDIAQLETRRASIQVARINFPLVPGQNDTANWDPAYFGNPAALVALANALDLKGEVIALNNDTKVPYSDQFNLGLRKQFGQVSTSITVAYIRYQNLFNWVLGNRYPDGSWCQHGTQFACQPWSQNLPGYGNLIVSVNDREARYRALYLTAEKPWTPSSRYGYTATLTLTDAEMNGHNDPFIFDYANPRDTGMHNAEGVDKWRFVGTGIVSGPWDTRVSSIVTLASGVPYGRVDETGPATRIIPGYYFPRRSFKQVDVRVSKDFSLFDGQTVTVDAQVYNLFNTWNYAYGTWSSGVDRGSGASHLPETNRQIGPSRSFQVGLTYKW